MPKSADSMLRMTLRTFVFTAILCLVCPVLASAAAGGLLHFAYTVSQQGDMAVGAVQAGPTVLLRFRGADADDVELRAHAVAQRLEQQALGGISPESIRATTLKSGAVILAGEALLATVDPVTANLAQTRPRVLAAQWAENIRAALGGPYLCVDVAGKLTVPLGESRRVRYGGSYSGELTVVTDPTDLISVADDQENAVLVITGLARGSGQMTLSAGDVSGSMPVECMPWAGTIQHPMVAQVSAPAVPPPIMRQAALNAVLANVNAAPGAVVALAKLHADSASARAEVSISGAGYLPRRETVTVSASTVPRPQTTPESVLVSNDPEKVTAPRTLLRQKLDGGAACRLLWHHVNAGKLPLTFLLRVVNIGDEPSRVFVLGSDAGPGRDEIHTGHVAMYSFWRMLLGSVGYLAAVPPGSAWEVYERSVRSGRITSGICELTNLGPQPVIVEMLASSDPTALPLVAVDPDADPLQEPSQFEYPGTTRAELVHEIGGSWSFLRVGKHDPDAETVQLAGHYGVMYDIRAKVVNHGQQPGRFEIAVTASGGVSRGLYLIDGQLVDTRLMRPLQEKVLFRGQVGAAATRSIPIQTIPQSGSNYPVTLVLRGVVK